MKLSDLQIRSTRPADKLIKLSDGGGLQMWIMPDGARRWRLAYRFDGRQRLMGVGVYPAVTLREARDIRDDARKMIAAGVDPITAKKTRKAARALASAATFNAIADELLARKRREKKAPRTLKKVEWILSMARQDLGRRPINEITAPEILMVLREVDARGAHETATRMRSVIGEVFRLAVATSRATIDPTPSLKGALTTPSVTHRAAITRPIEFGGLLRAIAGYDGDPPTVAALELMALLFPRPGELRFAEWREFDLENAVWEIPAEKMKMRRPHQIPLPPRAITILTNLKALTGRGKFVFPSLRSTVRPMSENTINAALRRMGYAQDKMTGHGFRAAASSMLNECGLWNPDAIERQLAHVDNDSVRRAYARAEFWDERVRMMNWWADKCAALRDGGEIVAFQKKGA